MNSLKLLSTLTAPVTWQQPGIHFLFAESYPLLFASRLFGCIQQQIETGITLHDLQTADVRSLKGAYETTFLGQRYVYVVTGLYQLSAKKRDEWLKYFAGYQGPHTLLVWTPTADDRAMALPESLNRTGYELVLRELYPDAPRDRCLHLAQLVFTRHESLSLDQACLIIEYAQVVGGMSRDFVDQWLEAIIPSEQSLFKVSAALFSGDRKLFFERYSEVKGSYSLPFWVSFWSDQVFRAAYFVKYKKEGNHALAKQMSYRLPFTFIQNGWRSMKPERLGIAHNMLYSADSAFKQGGSELILEDFYIRMLL